MDADEWMTTTTTNNGKQTTTTTMQTTSTPNHCKQLLMGWKWEGNNSQQEMMRGTNNKGMTWGDTNTSHI